MGAVIANRQLHDRLSEEFLQIDQLVFRSAKRLARDLRANAAVGSRPAAAHAPAIDDWLPQLLFTMRHRTLREWWMAAGGRLATVRRRIRERRLILASAQLATQQQAATALSDRIDLAAE